MTEAEKIAKLFADRRLLKPPVDVRRVLETIADVHEDRIPGDVDAVFLGKSKKRPRPVVILQRSVASTRKLFTMGHELGHAVIPWHAGTFFCHTDFNARLSDYAFKEIETEANRFASELLIPSVWVKSVAEDRRLDITQKISALQVSGLSALACSFSLVRQLPAGYFFAERDNAGLVKYSAKSARTPIDPPAINAQVAPLFLASCEEAETVGRISWWRMLPKDDHYEPARPASEILKEIFNDLSLPTSAANKAQQSINGIIGAANNNVRQTPHLSFLALLRGRFNGRAEISEIVSHPKFEEFLRTRVTELRSRHST